MHHSLLLLSFLAPAALARALPSSPLEPPSTGDALLDRSPNTASVARESFASPGSTERDSLYRYQNKVYLIRHGEKGKKGETGLNSKGKKRAKCLTKLLSSPRFKIGLILAEDYDRHTHKRQRPFDTVKPIADKLGLKVDTDCDVEDAKCVRRKVEKYAKKGGKGDVLICWKHSMLHEIAHALGAPKTTPYPDERYDIMWTLHHNRLISKESERCPGLDPRRSRKDDPDLEIDRFEVDGDESGREDLENLEDELELDWIFGAAGSDSQLRLADLD
ncbi:hypothetical protein JCM10212_006617 [Sporobolomyces blumeae]